MRSFLLAFVPLFVAVDAVGMLPMFLGLTAAMPPEHERRVIRQSVATAITVAALFIFCGPPLLRLLGLSLCDFMIAGGLLLFAITLSDLLAAGKTQSGVDPETAGVVPLGVPLIAGPAVLTTSLLLVHQHGRCVVLAALAANILLAGVAMRLARPIGRILGGAGTKAVSKIASLLLAAIAVMMIRKGVLALVAETTAA
jgi:multiple antibiotic resistance protein